MLVNSTPPYVPAANASITATSFSDDVEEASAGTGTSFV